MAFFEKTINALLGKKSKLNDDNFEWMEGYYDEDWKNIEGFKLNTLSCFIDSSNNVWFLLQENNKILACFAPNDNEVLVPVIRELLASNEYHDDWNFNKRALLVKNYPPLKKIIQIARNNAAFNSYDHMPTWVFFMLRKISEN